MRFIPPGRLGDTSRADEAFDTMLAHWQEHGFGWRSLVDPHTMPEWPRTFVDVNPVSHLVTAERGLMHGSATAGQVAWMLLASPALVAVFAPLTIHLYRTRP
jgi:hypothetical protein